MKSKWVICLVANVLIFSMTSWAADDGATLYKAKCAGCHGANGEGKPAMKGKAPHNKGISGLSAEQAKAIAEFIKTL